MLYVLDNYQNNKHPWWGIYKFPKWSPGVPLQTCLKKFMVIHFVKFLPFLNICLIHHLPPPKDVCRTKMNDIYLSCNILFCLIHEDIVLQWWTLLALLIGKFLVWISLSAKHFYFVFFVCFLSSQRDFTHTKKINDMTYTRRNMCIDHIEII